MKFTPLHDRVLIKPEKVADRIGLIYVPGTAKKEKGILRTGTVVAMGMGMKTKTGGRWPMPDGSNDLLPNVLGQRVYYFAQEGTITELKIEDELHHVVRDDALDALIHDDGTLEPLHDRVLVQRHDTVKKFGSLFIPDAAQQAPLTGVVLACGRAKIIDGETSRPLGVAAGDGVLFARYAGVEMPDGSIMMREADILVVFEQPEEPIADALLESEPAVGMETSP